MCELRVASLRVTSLRVESLRVTSFEVLACSKFRYYTLSNAGDSKGADMCTFLFAYDVTHSTVSLSGARQSDVTNVSTRNQRFLLVGVTISYTENMIKNS